MDFPPAPMAQLREFGLHEYAARAYLALLEQGESEARGVSEAADIPSAKVYSTLVQLQRRGLVRVTPGKPRLYAPVPIHEFVERQLREQEEKTSQLRANIDRLDEMFPLHSRASKTERARTSTILGRRNILQQLRACCESADEGIFVLASPALHADPLVQKHLARASSRGVSVHLAEDPHPQDLAELTTLFPRIDFAEAQQADGGSVLLATFDSNAAMLLRLQSGRRKQGQEGEIAIHTSERGICGALRRLVAIQLARRSRTEERATMTPPHAVHLDAATFAQRAAAQAASPPAEVHAVLHVQDPADVERDSLWRATRAATRAKILVNIATPRLEPHVQPRLPEHAEVRVLPRSVDVAFAILDGRQAFFASKPSSRRSPPDALYAITTDLAFVRALEEHFETGWAAARPLSARRTTP